MSEDYVVSQKPKIPTINVKVEVIGEHYLVSFKCREHLIFHSIKDVLDAIGKEFPDENPLPYDEAKNLNEEGKGFDALTDKQKEKIDKAFEEQLEAEMLYVTIDDIIMLFTTPIIRQKMGYREIEIEFPYDRILDWFFYKGL